MQFSVLYITMQFQSSIREQNEARPKMSERCQARQLHLLHAHVFKAVVLAVNIINIINTFIHQDQRNIHFSKNISIIETSENQL